MRRRSRRRARELVCSQPTQHTLRRTSTALPRFCEQGSFSRPSASARAAPPAHLPSCCACGFLLGACRGHPRPSACRTAPSSTRCGHTRSLPATPCCWRRPCPLSSVLLPLRFPRSSSRFEATADQLRVRLPRVPPIDSPEEGAPCCTSERPFLRFNLGRADCGWPALRTTAVPPLAFGY